MVTAEDQFYLWKCKFKQLQKLNRFDKWFSLDVRHFRNRIIGPEMFVIPISSIFRCLLFLSPQYSDVCYSYLFTAQMVFYLDYQWAYSSLEEQFAVPILICRRCFHGLQQDLFWFRDTSLFAIDVNENTSSFTSYIDNSWQILAQEPLEKGKERCLSNHFPVENTVVIWKPFSEWS